MVEQRKSREKLLRYGAIIAGSLTVTLLGAQLVSWFSEDTSGPNCKQIQDDAWQKNSSAEIVSYYGPQMDAIAEQLASTKQQLSDGKSGPVECYNAVEDNQLGIGTIAVRGGVQGVGDYCVIAAEIPAPPGLHRYYGVCAYR